MSALDEIIGSPPRYGRGCRVKGCENETRAVVTVAIRRFQDGQHTGGKYDGSVSRQASYCADHAVAIWRQALEVVLPS